MTFLVLSLNEYPVNVGPLPSTPELHANKRQVEQQLGRLFAREFPAEAGGLPEVALGEFGTPASVIPELRLLLKHVFGFLCGLGQKLAIPPWVTQPNKTFAFVFST